MEGKFGSARFLPPYNFSGVEPVAYGKAGVVIAPAPYDATSSWKTGARGGPAAIIAASRWLEAEDEELGFDASSLGFHTLDEIEPDYDSPEKNLRGVGDVVSAIFSDGKFPLLLGGDHSLSIAAFRALKKFHPGAGVLYFDAHADLREEFEGTRFGHASAARRALDLGLKVAQVGIRSVSSECLGVYEKNPAAIRPYYAHDKAIWDLGALVKFLPEEIYVSFDVDAFDSSLMPATGTPEPGGLFWEDAVAVLRAVSAKRKIVGADVMELSPIPGMHACDFLAAKLAYKLVGFASAGARR